MADPGEAEINDGVGAVRGPVVDRVPEVALAETRSLVMVAAF
jgi:hypothetical protein